MKRGVVFFSILLLAAAVPCAAQNVNKSIRIADRDQVEKDVSTVNGQIEIGHGATVRGEAESVNGSIEVGDGVQIDAVNTVNGVIEIGRDTTVDGDVETVNGGIRMGSGSRARSVASVNGALTLDGVDVEHDVSTYNGDITLRDSEIGGDVVIRDSNSRSNHRRGVLKISIEDGTVVHGDVVVEDPDMKVEVHLRGGTVSGEIRGAKIVD